MSAHLSDFDGQRLVMVGRAKATDGREVLRAYVVDFGAAGSNVATYKVVPEEVDYVAFVNIAGLGSPEAAAEDAANRVSIAASQAGYYGLVRELHGLFLSLAHGAAETHPKNLAVARLARCLHPFLAAVMTATAWLGMWVVGSPMSAGVLVLAVVASCALVALLRWLEGA